MKKIFLFLIFAFTYSNAQYLVEDNDISDNTKEVGRQTVSYDLNNPLEFYRLKCYNAIYAQFPGGENAFKQKLFLNMKSDLDNSFYSVNGTFELIITINKSGNMQSFKLNPEVQNSNLLKRDLELALRKMNPKFTPATCDGVPIESKIRQKINFRTDNFDI
ncbi:hypothetical protein IV494_10440 [Kaistella sp. G5-32]|uniref:TonB-like protein n=1 Tax=Kaistella gelatinilytica TaxID=2787636 RepID=A0ABS0FD03_9FLAO|nr:hypothetical protein [Kaistella gelatinilytica]MBF8457596.1 hypothetical protein [Kaistella gelatinilytica]